MNGLQNLLSIATLAARRAAAHIRAQRRPATEGWDLKGTSDFVTVVDRETEAIIAETLVDGAPDSAVLGEELTPDTTVADLLWVVDPLDGTTNYLHGYPAYAVSIAGLVDGEPKVGVVLDVPHDALYHATARGGAWCGGQRLEVSQINDPTHALIGTGWPFKRPQLLSAYLSHFSAILRATAGIRRGGAASLDLVDVALGRFEGFFEPYLAPWDVAAGALIVREAGGVVTDYTGEDEILRHGGFVAGNPTIHRWLLGILHQQDAGAVVSDLP